MRLRDEVGVGVGKEQCGRYGEYGVGTGLQVVVHEHVHGAAAVLWQDSRQRAAQPQQTTAPRNPTHTHVNDSRVLPEQRTVVGPAPAARVVQRRARGPPALVRRDVGRGRGDGAELHGLVLGAHDLRRVVEGRPRVHRLVQGRRGGQVAWRGVGQ